MSAPTLNSINGYEPMLRESIHHFLALYRKGGSDFSALESIFFRLVQTTPDPPLEVILFHSAVAFHSSKRTLSQEQASKKILVAKELFQLLVSCSSPCSGTKKVAVLAPLIYELYNLACEHWKKDLCLKREIDCLLEGIANYIIICCRNDFEEWENEMGNSMLCCEDLVQVWTVDRVGESYKFGDNLKVFFPVLTDEARQAINVDFGTDCLAGVVMNEVLLLRLCLKFGFGVPKQELQRDIQNLAVQTIKGFQNYCFLDMLLRMQLESTLPVTIFLSSEDVVLLRKVLYDAMILFDHSSLNFVRSTMLFDTNLKDLALLWSIVADYAIQFAREICDHNRAISYVNTFSKSHLPSELISWVANQAGMETNLNRPNISTPSALIRWLFVVEDRTSGIFGHGVLKLHAKAVICRSRDYNSENVFFHVRNGEVARDRINEDQEMADSMDDSLLATEGRRKRKEETRDGETPVKHVKYNFPKNSDGTKLLPFLGSDDLRVGSLVNNAVCDECMEDMG